MNCPHCSKSIELKDVKDKKTGFWSNFWFCKECDKTVDPTNVGQGPAMKIIEDALQAAYARKAKDYWFQDPYYNVSLDDSDGD